MRLGDKIIEKKRSNVCIPFVSLGIILFFPLSRFSFFSFFHFALSTANNKRPSGRRKVNWRKENWN